MTPDRVALAVTEATAVFGVTKPDGSVSWKLHVLRPSGTMSRCGKFGVDRMALRLPEIMKSAFCGACIRADTVSVDTFFADVVAVVNKARHDL